MIQTFLIFLKNVFLYGNNDILSLKLFVEALEVGLNFGNSKFNNHYVFFKQQYVHVLHRNSILIQIS